MRTLLTKQQRDDERAFESAVQYARSTWNSGCVSFNKAVEGAAKQYKVDARAVADEVLKRSKRGKEE